MSTTIEFSAFKIDGIQTADLNLLEGGLIDEVL